MNFCQLLQLGKRSLTLANELLERSLINLSTHVFHSLHSEHAPILARQYYFCREYIENIQTGLRVSRAKSVDA